MLDDSYSMQAGGDDSPRQRASQKLADEFRRTDYVARVILAGAQPRLLGSTVRSADQLQRDRWTSGLARLRPPAWKSAIALAGEIGGDSSRILVVSDHAPDGDLPAGKSSGGASGNRWETLPSRPPRAIRRSAEQRTGGPRAAWK